MENARTSEETIALAHAYLNRRIPAEEQVEFVKRSFPHAGAEILDAARFHLLVDLPRALADVMAELELCARHPERRLKLHGYAEHLIYHLYNYLLLESLLERGSQKLTDLVAELRRCRDDDDPEGVDATIKSLEQLLSGSSAPPEIG